MPLISERLTTIGINNNGYTVIAEVPTDFAGRNNLPVGWVVAAIHPDGNAVVWYAHPSVGANDNGFTFYGSHYRAAGDPADNRDRAIQLMAQIAANRIL